MRALMILPMAMALGGCFSQLLDAKPMHFTCGPRLEYHMQTFQPSPLFKQLQRDAGFDEGTIDALAGPVGASLDDGDGKDDAIIGALRAAAARHSAKAIGTGPKTLMLSGGGSWGAFGAGFLRDKGIRDWAVVTGISTGSLQSLFVAAGDYDRMVREYGITRQEDLALTNSLFGAVRKGSEYDLAPLRRKLMDYLLPATGELPFERMMKPGSPELFIGMVEARSGDMKVVAVSAMVRQVYSGTAPPDRAKVAALAECVAGVALASSSIPVRLSPVQIDQRTYFDGGVRSSVFDAAVARRQDIASKSLGAPPELYVIRNGPTIVFRDAKEEKRGRETDRYAVDAKPHVLRVGMRGYSTIVNQSELMSIAALRLSYPRGQIFVMTADGFNNAAVNPVPCGPRPGEVFNAKFMDCLIRWGSHKAKAPSLPWIELDQLLLENR
ncbi:patatin-like phospholipase family protein [Sphingomonas sp. R647]|uniref:patatin-like phospholipase family protein n=1 Tax=Sphingomonas sp. R647 TaxID=2875233 RepID=UPI001CD58E31|nr:patatin-like phospholipase family protein [Sphingomonas sp. R647]MCA1200130.1 patatin-like phospholipase family protein [Sphingomonas sp. R647]